MTEIWKDIPGFEGSYQVSNMGRVKSLPRTQTWHKKNGTTFDRYIPGRILRPGASTGGHLYVVLGHGKHGVPIHHLVMLAFVGPRTNGMDICHNDGNPKNNALNNLRYDTRRENIMDEYRAGRGHLAKLTDQQVRDIRNLIQKGESCVAIARRYGLSNGTIRNIKSGRTYTWVP